MTHALQTFPMVASKSLVRLRRRVQRMISLQGKRYGREKVCLNCSPGTRGDKKEGFKVQTFSAGVNSGRLQGAYRGKHVRRTRQT